MTDRPFDVLVAEDEPAAREFLAASLRTHGFRVVAAVGSGRAALAAIADTRPEALFLDVRMPGGSGLDVARQVARSEGPLCVFVTAHQTFALSAFEVHAVDYLLKPFDDRRLAQCCRWLARQLTGRRAGVTLAGAPVGAVGSGRLVIKSAGTIRFVPWDDITHLTADGYCAHVHAGPAIHHVRATLTHLQARLPASFVRVHRSTVVNVRAVVRVDPTGHGDAVATLCGGATVRVARDRRAALTGLSVHPPTSP